MPRFFFHCTTSYHLQSAVLSAYQGKFPATLHYFPVRGRAEALRMLLRTAGIPYVDRLYTPEEWSVTLPLPLLSYILTHFAIYAYLYARFLQHLIVTNGYRNVMLSTGVQLNVHFDHFVVFRVCMHRCIMIKFS